MKMGRGRARWTQSSYGQPTASHECEQYQTTRKHKNQNLVKWVTRHVLHSCSDLSCFSFLGFLYGFVLLWGSPFGLFGFCCFLNGFHEFSLCSSRLSCLGQREGPRSLSGPQIRAPANILFMAGWGREHLSEGSTRRARWFKSSYQNHCVLS